MVSLEKKNLKWGFHLYNSEGKLNWNAQFKIEKVAGWAFGNLTYDTQMLGFIWLFMNKPITWFGSRIFYSKPHIQKTEVCAEFGLRENM